MDMELERRTLPVYKTVLDTSVIHDETTEIIVPDASPDIARIICASGHGYIKEKSARDGKVDVSGTIKGCVLYVSEGDDAIRKLDVSIPFNHSFDAGGVTSDSFVTVNSWMQNFEAREVNPRKIAVRANVGIWAKAYEQSELEICSDLSEANDYAVQMKKHKFGIYAPVAVKNKGFTISDDVEVPANKPQFEMLVSHNTELDITDTKIIGSKGIVKGNAYISYLYLTKEGGMSSCEHELPFSQIIDVDGMDEDCKLKVKLNIRGVELEPQHDITGDTRFISVSILTDAYAFAYRDDEIEVIEDIYSTKYELSCGFDSKAIPDFAEHISKRVAVNETIETASAINSVVDFQVRLEPAFKRKEEGVESLVSEAVIEVTYVGEDGGVYSAFRRCTTVCQVGEMGEVSFDTSVKVSGKSYSLPGGNEIIVRFHADYETDAIETQKVVYVSKAEVDTERSKTCENSPSVIIKYINSDQPLWETAKRHNTTMHEIAAANALDNEEVVRAGSMLLIPKAR